MPPKKRKADATNASPTPKKSKQEARAEALAKARAWHEARSSKGGGGSAAKSSSTAAVSSSPSFSAGKASSSKKKASTPPSKTSSTAGSTTKRRRTPSRKSTGGISSRATATSPVEEEAPTPARKSRRSIAASSPSLFEFDAPEEGGTKDSAVQSTGPASKNSPVKYEFGNRDSEEEEDEEEEKKPSAAKANKRADGLAKIRELHQQREMRKNPPKRRNSLDPPTESTAVAAAKTSLTTTTTKLNSPDPPSATKPPPAAAAASATTTKPPSSKKKPAKKQPPASVASLFAAPKTKSYAHRPYKQKFDPNKPFPSTGYKLPTAAYCGCGPTPGSNTTSVRGGVVPDTCVVNDVADAARNSTRNGSFTNENMRETMQLISVVDPPFKSRYGGDTGDERKMPARPSPPGRNGNDGGEEGDNVTGKKDEEGEARANNDSAVPAAPAATAPNAGVLQAAMLRAKSLVSSAAAGNQKRRSMMGIRGSNSGNQNNQTAAGQQTANVGMPPRDVIQTGVANNTEGDVKESNLKGPVDPPMIDSAPIQYAATLQKFRAAGGGVGMNNPSETKADDVKSDDNATAATTVAGEHTSEVGEESRVSSNEDAKLTDEKKRPSFLKRGCLAIMKLVMFVEMACGILYLAKEYNWSDFVQPISEKLLESKMDSATTEDKSSTCFLDYPDWEQHGSAPVEDEMNSDEGCEGYYKQCPPWGRCYNGFLRDCQDGDAVYFEGGMNRFVPNERGDTCVLSPQAEELVGVVQETLGGMTTALTCRSWDRITDPGDMLDGDPFPLFRLEKVAEKIAREASVTFKDNVEFVTTDFLIWLSPVFDETLVRFGALSGDSGDDLDAIGLGVGVPEESLPLPIVCTMKFLFWELLEYFCTFAWKFATFSTVHIWWLLSTYPIYSISTFALWHILALFQRKRKHRAKVRELFGTVLEAVYDRLSECEDHEGYAALLLRDDVGHDMYPTDFRARQFMFDSVWPRVTLEIRADNRVRKFRRVANGKELEHWDFAIQSKRRRRLSRSLGTPNSSRSEDVKVKTEDVAPKRDP